MEAEFLSAWCDFYPGSYPEAAVTFFRFAQTHPKSEDVREATHLALVSCSRYAESGEVPLDRKTAFLQQLTSDFAGSDLAREAHFHLGRLAIEASKDFADAVQHFEAALQGRRSDQVGFYMGVCHQNLGNVEQAVRWYRRAIRESKYDMPRKRAISALRALESSE
jgi:TolA-binding protein